MPKILMIQSALGADALEDGTNFGVSNFEAGTEYDVCSELARQFIELKVAKLSSVNKKMAAAPENKSAE